MRSAAKRNTGHGRSKRGACAAAFIGLAFFFLFLPGTKVLCAEDELPKAEEILDKYIEAVGGKEAFDRIDNQVLKVTLEIVGQGIKMHVTVYSARPNKVYRVVEVPSIGKGESGVDGEVVWENSAMTGPQIMEGSVREQALRDATFHKLVYWQKVYEKAECAGIQAVDEKPCYKVVLTPKEGSEDTLFIDKESHLIVKAESTSESPMGKIPLEIYISDYKEMNGIRIPQRLRQVVMGQERMIKTEGVLFNLQFPAHLFKLPPEIQELVDRKKEKSKGVKDQ